MRKRITDVLVVLALAAGLTRTAAAAEPIEAVCTKAASDPTLTWYSSQEETRNQAAITAFHKRYPGVKVESLRLVTGRLAARYAAERSAGVNNAGLITLGDPIFIAQGQKAGWFVDFAQSDMPALAKLDPRWFDHGAATSTISMLGIAFNKDLVGKDAPKTWTDLLDPKWKGRLLMGDPRSVPSYMALARIWDEKYGDDFLVKLAAQKPTWVPSVVPVTQQLAAGEVPIVAPNVLSVVTPLKSEGAPIDLVIPDTTTGNEFAVLISKGTASPNASWCLYNFLFTPEGQEAFTGPVSASTMGPNGDVSGLPANYIDPRIPELGPVEPKLLKLLGLQ
jgi:iron(III) transport system substrate-binding protein